MATEQMVQALLALSLNPAARARFAADPASFCRESGLTSEEEAALVSRSADNVDLALGKSTTALMISVTSPDNDAFVAPLMISVATTGHEAFIAPLMISVASAGN